MPAPDPFHPAPAGPRRFPRYARLLAAALLVAVPGAFVALTDPAPTHTAQGSLLVPPTLRARLGDVAPVRATDAPVGTAWISLLRSYEVLESVVVEHRLFLRTPANRAPAFRTFALADPFAPGAYELRVGPTGEDWVLETRREARVQEGRFGEPIGRNVGFLWTPAPGSFEPGAVVRFTVVSPRDAAHELSTRLLAVVDPAANLLRVELTGSSPERTAPVLDALMERHVEVAGELKSARLTMTLQILEEQLEAMELELMRAERELAEFRAAHDDVPAGPSGSDAAALQARVSGAVEEARLARRIQTTEILYDEVRRRVEDARLAVASWTPDVRIVERASFVERPRGAPHLWIAVAVFLGCLGATLCALSVTLAGARGGPGAHRTSTGGIGDDLIAILAIVVGGLLAVIATTLTIS